MSMAVRSKVVKIGNSRGIRIPKTLIEQAGLTDDVEMIVEGDKLIVHSARRPRQSWELQFASMAEHGDDHMPEEPIPTLWDDEEWTW